jgi:hypothetical protein
MITDAKIKQGMEKAYKKAGHNTYFSNGFEAGVRFALEQVKNITYEPVLSVVDSDAKEEKEKIITAILYEHMDHHSGKVSELDFDAVVADVIKHT